MTPDTIAPIHTGGAPRIDEALERRRAAAASAWSLRDEIVLVGAGDPIHVPGRADLTYPFRAHSEYFYLTDRERPGGVLAFDPAEGWADFVVPVSRAETLWEGTQPDSVHGLPIGELDGWLARRAGRHVGWLGVPGAYPAGSDAELAGRLRRALNDVRRPKDAVELERIRVAQAATRAGFLAVRELLTPGRSERQIQIELEAEFQRHGGDRPGYGTIVATGTNSAVLHFPPSERRLRDGELVLIDAGAEHRGYVADVTRTYSVSGALTPEQEAVHAIVARALDAATALCRPGAEYREAHLAAAHVVAEGLVDLGVLRGEADALVQRGAVSLFMPHGIGHLVGLGVRDASEILPGRSPDPSVFPGLRLDLTLGEGYVVTVEPGLYFVPALLGEPEARERLRGLVDWDAVERWLAFGGVRLENDVLITEDGCENLSPGIPLAAA